MSQHFNQLNPAEDERLAHLVQEMGEALQMAGKVLMHGYNSVDPKNPDGPNNRLLLTNELAHVVAAIESMIRANDLYGSAFPGFVVEKQERWLRYAHHQPPASEAGNRTGESSLF